MARKLFSIRGSEITESGIFKSTHALDAPLWRDGVNVIFKNGGAQKIGGSTQVASQSVTSPVRGAEAYQLSDNIQRLFFGTTDKLYMYVPGSGVTQEGTGYSGNEHEGATSIATTWSFTSFGDIIIATNGTSAPQIWKLTTNAFAALSSETGATGVPSTAEIVMRIRGHILFFNTNAGDNTVAFSDVENPAIYTASTTNAAGSLVVRDMNGAIKAAVPFKDGALVLGKDQAFIVKHVGSPFFFTYKQVTTGIGAVSKASVIVVNNIAYGMGQRGIWQFDGLNYRYIDTPALQEFIQENWEDSELSKVCATYDLENKTIYWFIPTSNNAENSIGVVYNVQNGSWSRIDFGRTAAVPYMGAFKHPYMFAHSGSTASLRSHNTEVNDNGSALTATLTSKPLDFNEAGAFKSITFVSLQMRTLTGTVNVRLGTQNNLDDSVSFSSSTALDDGFEKINVRQTGRFITLEVSSSATGANWAMTGFDMYGVPAGRI